MSADGAPEVYDREARVREGIAANRRPTHSLDSRCPLQGCPECDHAPSRVPSEPITQHDPKPLGDGRWYYGCPDTTLLWTFPNEASCREFSALHVEVMHNVSGGSTPNLVRPMRSSAPSEPSS